jgi:CRP-like cAMP-binding protein
MSSTAKQTKYEGEDQLLLGTFKRGETFGYLGYIFDEKIPPPFTIKTNEKTRLILIESKAVELYCKDHILEEFNSKYRFMKELKCLGDTRHSFIRMLPIIMRSKLKRVAKNTLIVRQGEPTGKIYFIKQGSCSVLRQLKFIKPSFARTIPSLALDNEALY